MSGDENPQPTKSRAKWWIFGLIGVVLAWTLGANLGLLPASINFTQNGIVTGKTPEEMEAFLMENGDTVIVGEIREAFPEDWENLVQRVTDLHNSGTNDPALARQYHAALDEIYANNNHYILRAPDGHLLDLLDRQIDLTRHLSRESPEACVQGVIGYIPDGDPTSFEQRWNAFQVAGIRAMRAGRERNSVAPRKTHEHIRQAHEDALRFVDPQAASRVFGSGDIADSASFDQQCNDLLQELLAARSLRPEWAANRVAIIYTQ